MSNVEPWPRAEILQFVVDSRAPGTGWQVIAADLNDYGQVDIDGKRWTVWRVKRAHTEHPDKVPSFMRGGPPRKCVLLPEPMSPEEAEAQRQGNLPGTVVGRRALWNWIHK